MPSFQHYIDLAKTIDKHREVKQQPCDCLIKAQTTGKIIAGELKVITTFSSGLSQ